MKRSRTSGGSVTGGTGDVKPQIFTLNTGFAPAADQYAVNTVVLPVPRFGTMKTKATIFEILSVDWYLNFQNIADMLTFEVAHLTTSTNRQSGDTISYVTTNDDIVDPRSFANVVSGSAFLTSGGVMRVYPIHIDLTDNNGNGMLIATDRITIVGGGIGNAQAGDYIAKVKYRMVNVGIAEYVGIVQSQQ